jgi:hypothetical protein
MIRHYLVTMLGVEEPQEVPCHWPWVEVGSHVEHSCNRVIG